MGAYVIVGVKLSTFYLIMTALCFCSTLTLLFITDPEKVNQVDNNYNDINLSE